MFTLYLIEALAAFENAIDFVRRGSISVFGKHINYHFQVSHSDTLPPSSQELTSKDFGELLPALATLVIDAVEGKETNDTFAFNTGSGYLLLNIDISEV